MVDRKHGGGDLSVERKRFEQQQQTLMENNNKKINI